jgi:hypothetical protein
MNDSNQNGFNVEIAEIERLIREFKEKFAVGTANADDFMTISELESMWGELQNRTNNIYSDMIRKLMSEVDESDLIRKKKTLQTQRDNAQNPRQERHYSCNHFRKAVLLQVFTDPKRFRKRGTSASINGRKEHSSNGFLSRPIGTAF